MSIIATLREKIFRKGDQEKYDSTWVNLENIMLSEIRQTQKDKYYMVPLTRGP